MHTRGTHARRAAVVVALAGALALVAAGTAQADFTTSVTGTTVTITGSTGNDVINMVGARPGHATLPTVGSATVRRRHGRLVAGLAVACPASSDVNGVVGVCAAKITLKAAHGGRTLGSKLLTVAGGAGTRVQILLARVTDRLVRRARLPVRVHATTADGDSTTISMRLRVPR